jgi:hypothetical protein
MNGGKIHLTYHVTHAIAECQIAIRTIAKVPNYDYITTDYCEMMFTYTSYTKFTDNVMSLIGYNPQGYWS